MNIPIRHWGFGSLPISKLALLSANGPVVRDPPSARDISGQRSAIVHLINDQISMLTHWSQTFAHQQIPLVLGKYANVLVQTRPMWFTSLTVIFGPIRSCFSLWNYIIGNLVDFSRIADLRIHMHFWQLREEMQHPFIILVGIHRFPHTE